MQIKKIHIYTIKTAKKNLQISLIRINSATIPQEKWDDDIGETVLDKKGPHDKEKSATSGKRRGNIEKI